MFSSLHTSALALSRVKRLSGQGLVATLLDRMDLARQRRQLARLDDALLRDIGLTRGEALTEAQRSVFDDGRKPLWNAPAYWFQSAVLPRG